MMGLFRIRSNYLPHNITETRRITRAKLLDCFKTLDAQYFAVPQINAATLELNRQCPTPRLRASPLNPRHREQPGIEPGQLIRTVVRFSVISLCVAE